MRPSQPTAGRSGKDQPSGADRRLAGKRPALGRRRPERSASSRALLPLERLGRGWARVTQELPDPLDLVLLADRGGRRAEKMKRAQEAPVGLVLPGNRAITPPARPAEKVEAAVIARPCVGVGRDRVAGQRPLGQGGPRGGGRRGSCRAAA